MITIQRILCPVDFSRFSLHAFEQAVDLAREFGADITVLHASAVAPVTALVPVGAPIPLELAIHDEPRDQALVDRAHVPHRIPDAIAAAPDLDLLANRGHLLPGYSLRAISSSMTSLAPP